MTLLSASIDATRSRVQGALSRSDTLRRLVGLSSWTLVSFGLDKGAAVVVVFFLARILGAEDYGRLTLAQGMVNTLQIVVVLGAGAVLGRYVPAFRQDGFRRAVEIINLCALVVLCAATAFVLAAVTFGKPVMAGALNLPAGSVIPAWVMAWVVLTAGVNLLMTVLLSFERGRALGLVSLVGAGLSITMIPMLAASYGLTGAITGLVAVEALKLVALAALYGRLAASEGVPLFTRPRRADLPLLARFGVPVFLTSALWAPTMWLAQLIVSTRSPGGLSDVGVFGFVNSVLGAVILISSLTNRAALPILASLQAEGRVAELRRVSWVMALGQFAAAAVIAVPLALAAPWIMGLAGPTFAAQWPVLVIMIATGVLLSAQTALGNFLLVTERQVFLLATMVGWSIFVTGLTAAMTAWGGYGLAVALLIGAVLRTAAIALAFLQDARPVTRAAVIRVGAGSVLGIEDGETAPAMQGRLRCQPDLQGGRILIFQPALPSYRMDFFERLYRAVGPAFRVLYSPEPLGVLTQTADTPAWAQTVGLMHRPAPGLEWQEGVLSVGLKRGDLVVVSGAPRCPTNLLLLAKARLSGATTVWWGHYWSSTSRPHRWALRMQLMRMADAILFYTDLEVAEYRAGAGARDRRPVFALNNGIDIEPIARLRTPYTPETRDCAGLFIGRLTDKARLDLLIQALTQPGLEAFRLHVIGDGPDRPRLQGLAAALGVATKIEWHPATVDEERIAAVANRCRLFVYPGSVGLSVVHAMAYGLPSVVHDVRRLHMPEISAFTNRVTGVSFTWEDPVSLAEALASCLADDDRLCRMSDACVRVTRDGYNTATMAERFAQLVQHLREDWYPSSDLPRRLGLAVSGRPTLDAGAIGDVRETPASAHDRAGGQQ